ncbi:hypothetical protein F0562_001922 [Nyssa sinensis]|uniref:Uncharacterized protein n=1 Tax=Nyssa sinensis TaxID=561372 RepID=A0A5J5C4L7_9ASTE|nr:hypothetical protein F0562_001922 [Nyssa sinensis]
MVEVEGSSLHDVSTHASFNPCQEEATVTPQEHEPIMDPSVGHPDSRSTYLVQRRSRQPIQPGPQIQDPYESAPVVVIQQLTQQEDLLDQLCMKKDDFLILSMMVIHIPPSPPLMRNDIIDSMKACGHVSFKRELFHHILTYGVVSMNEFEIMHHRLPQQAQRDLKKLEKKKEKKSQNGVEKTNDLMDELMQFKDDEGKQLSDIEVLDNVVSLTNPLPSQPCGRSIILLRRSRFQILQDPNTTLLLEASVSQPLGPNSVSRNSGSNHKMLSDGLSQVINSDCALSFLSSAPAETREIGLSHMMQPCPIPRAQPLIPNLHYSGQGQFPCSQEVENKPSVSVFNSDGSNDNTNLHFQGMFQNVLDGSSANEPRQQMFSFLWE